MASPRVTDDHFLLVIDQSDAAFDVEAVNRLLTEHHAIATEQRVVAEEELP